DFESLTPPYWINMGAVAITTLAGATLILHQNEFGLILEITPFLKGFTTFFWITGTWWIPLLFILMIWRHVVHRFPLTYDPQYWGMAFPLAMYTTSTWQLAQALELPFLRIIPQIMGLIAVLVYIAVFLGFLHHIYRDVQFFHRAKKRQEVYSPCRFYYMQSNVHINPCCPSNPVLHLLRYLLRRNHLHLHPQRQSALLASYAFLLLWCGHTYHKHHLLQTYNQRCRYHPLRFLRQSCRCLLFHLTHTLQIPYRLRPKRARPRK